MNFKKEIYTREELPGRLALALAFTKQVTRAGSGVFLRGNDTHVANDNLWQNGAARGRGALKIRVCGGAGRASHMRAVPF